MSAGDLFVSPSESEDDLVLELVQPPAPLLLSSHAAPSGQPLPLGPGATTITPRRLELVFPSGQGDRSRALARLEGLHPRKRPKGPGEGPLSTNAPRPFLKQYASPSARENAAQAPPMVIELDSSDDEDSFGEVPSRFFSAATTPRTHSPHTVPAPLAVIPTLTQRHPAQPTATRRVHDQVTNASPTNNWSSPSPAPSPFTTPHPPTRQTPPTKSVPPLTTMVTPHTKSVPPHTKGVPPHTNMVPAPPVNAIASAPSTRPVSGARSFVNSFLTPTVIDSSSEDEVLIIEERTVPRTSRPPEFNAPAPIPHHDGTAASAASLNQIRASQTTTQTHLLLTHLSTIQQGISNGLQKVKRFSYEVTQATGQKSRILTAMSSLVEALNTERNSAKQTTYKRNLENYRGILDSCNRTILQHERTVKESNHQVESLRLAFNSGVLQLHRLDPEKYREYTTLLRTAPQVGTPSAPPGYTPNIYTLMTDEDQRLEELIDNMRPDEDIDGVATPPELLITLLPHQRKGLAWLQQMEAKPSNRGGILADDMGLGKTVQALSLILSRPLEDPKRKTTLVVTPVALLQQWEAEIKSKVKRSLRLRVSIYRGGQSRSFSALALDDVVLVSYGTLSSEMKKHFGNVSAAEAGGEGPSEAGGANFRGGGFQSRLTAGNRAGGREAEGAVVGGLPDEASGGTTYISPFFSRASIFHRIIIDEAQWIKNKKTLASKLCAMVKANFRWCLSGTPMQNGVTELYPLIRFLKIQPYCTESRFRSDIAIPLKNQSGSYGLDDTDRAMRRLRALLAAILLRRTKNSTIDGKPILSLPEKHVSMAKVVMVKTEDAYYKALEDRSQKDAKVLLGGGGGFSNIFTLLLRLRQACCHSFLVEVGVRNSKEQARVGNWKVQYEDVMKFGEEEVRRVRQALGEDGSAAMGCIERKPSVNPTALPLIKRPESPLIESGIPLGSPNPLGASSGTPGPLGSELPGACTLCYSPPAPQDLSLLSQCGHLICNACLPLFFERYAENEAEEGHRVAKCPICRKLALEAHSIDYDMFRKVWVDKWNGAQIAAHFAKASPRAKSKDDQIRALIQENGGKFVPLAKMNQALALIEQILAKDPLDKIIIFSQFTLLFNLLKIVLDERGILFLRYDGSMTGEARNSTITEFYNNPQKSVLLLSLKAGNVGLTLTCANHVIIMDPFWNPFVEEQAMDRAHRIGQHKEVFVHRLLIGETVEDRIMQLQEKKKELVESALDEKGMKVAGSLGRQELGFLFGLNKLQR